MKRFICMLLAAIMIFTLCACSGGGEAGGGDNGGAADMIDARTLIAAAQQESGEKKASSLVASGDKDFDAMVKSYLHLDASAIADGAIALSEGTAANEIIVLVPADGTDIKTLTDAFETHRTERIQSDANYFPENAALFETATVYEKGGYAVMVVDENADALCASLDSLMTRADDAKSLAAKYDEDAAVAAQGYDYSKPVPESDAVDSMWFSDAMFIGDSRMKSIMDYASRKSWFEYGADLSAVSLTVSKIYTETVNYKGTTMSIADAIRSGDSYSKCYIMLGLNELGWASTDTFIEDYREIINLVRDSHPDIQIYVIGIMPLGDKALDGGSWLTNDRVKLYNSLILDMCTEEEVYFIDNFDLLAPNGKLDDDAAVDGIHVEPGYSKMLVDFLLTHTVAK